MKTLLVSLNSECQPQPVYPLGLDYIRSALNKDGIGAEVFDCSAYPEEEREQALRNAAEKSRPDFVLFSLRNIDSIESAGTSYYLPAALLLIAAAGEACRAPRIIGGSGFSLFPETILKLSGADYGVKGPGEFIIGRLLQKLASGEDVTDVPGLVYRTGRSPEIAVNEPCSGSSFGGVPSRPSELVKFYWQRGGLLNVQAKRGCPLHCVYCTYPQLGGRTIGLRRTDEVADELQALFEEHAVNHFFIVDDVFNIVPHAANALAEELIRRKLPIKWTAYFSPKNVETADILLWQRSGLSAIEFGIDTLSEVLLSTYRKNFSLADVHSAAQSCRTAGVPYSLSLIFGGPGENMQTLDEGLANCAKLKGAVFMALVGMRIYPNTGIYQKALEERVIGAETDLLEPVFYISPELDRQYLDQRLGELSERPNWLIAGCAMQQKRKAASVLRKHGYKGSLWEQCAVEN